MITGVPDVGTVPKSIAARPRVAGIVVVRAGGLPVTAVDDLAAPDTMRALREAGEHERSAAALADTVSEGLYRAVPTLADQSVRRSAVVLRRDVHNGRWSARTGAGVAAVSPALPAAVAGDLDRWAQLIQLAQERRVAATGYSGIETGRALKAMHGHLTGARIARGLALASPVFTDRLLAEPLRGNADSRVVRTATAYLLRTALKTSPFSTLTTVGLAAFRPAADHTVPPPELPTRAVSSARPLAVTFLLACVRHTGAVKTVDVAGVEGLRRVAGRWFAVLPFRVVTPHAVFRADELTCCEGAAWALPTLPAEPVGLAELLAAPGILAEAGPPAVRRLLGVGVLQSVLPYPNCTVHDFGALARWARTRVPALPADAADALGRLAAQEEVIAGQAGATQRCAAVTAARVAAGEAFTALGVPEPGWLRDLPLFHEVDAGGPIRSLALPATVHDDLAETARWLVPLTWRHPTYEALVRGFVRRHGRGAAGVDLLEFLYAFLTATGLTATGGVALSAPTSPPDGGTARDPARLRGDLTLGHAAHTVFFQLAAGSAQEVAAGAHLAVITNVHTGGIGLLGRWTTVPAVHERIGTPLAEWARQLHPGCRVYQVCPGADWTDLQRPVLRTLPQVRLPGDLPTGDGLTTLSGMTLAHRAASASLQVSGRDGAPVAFAYLGTMPQHLLTGVARLLCLLSNPWVTFGRIDRDRRVKDDTDGTAVLPRVQRGRVVWARTRWSFPIATLPQPGKSDLKFLIDIERWWAQHGLPEEAFVSHITRSHGQVHRDKPQWIGTEHPHAIRVALGRIPPGTSTVDITEALPCRAQHWVRDADDNPVATEFLAMVRHA